LTFRVSARCTVFPSLYCGIHPPPRATSLVLFDAVICSVSFGLVVFHRSVDNDIYFPPRAVFFCRCGNSPFQENSRLLFCVSYVLFPSQPPERGNLPCCAAFHVHAFVSCSRPLRPRCSPHMCDGSEPHDPSRLYTATRVFHLRK